MNVRAKKLASDPVAPITPRSPVAGRTAYWDHVATAWHVDGDGPCWRRISDAANRALMRRWLPAVPDGSVLKTDLFDEVAGAGLVPWLSSRFANVAGVDLSPSLVEMAQERFPDLNAKAADVRKLPFPEGRFDSVVSNSTLDHLPSVDDIATSLAEIRRVLRPGGTLLVTLDNPVNPVVAIRNAVPSRLRAASHLVPFAVGATCGPRRLRALLEQVGFVVDRTGAVSHAPRTLVVLLGHLLDRYGGATAKDRYVRFWNGFERLERLPTRYLTGYFVAALAHRR